MMVKAVDTEYVENDLEYGEDTGFDYRDGVQQRADRCRCHHRRGQPAVHGHNGRLAHAKHKQAQQQADCRPPELAVEYAAGNEVTAPGGVVGPDNRRQQ